MGSSAPITVAGPSVLITHPGEDFIFGCPQGTTWLHNVIAFNGPLVEDFIRQGLLPLDRKPPVYAIRDAITFYELFSRCCTLFHHGERFHHRAVHTLVSLLLQIYEERTFPAPSDDNAQRLSELTRRISADPATKWNFPSEAKALHISYAHLRRLFKEITGTSPQRYLQKTRLTHAGKLLISTRLPVKEIAHTVGISDLQYFTRIFRQHYQLPPSQFRNAHGIATLEVPPNCDKQKKG